MAGLVPRLAYYPTLFYNVVMNKLSYREWFTRIDHAVILGALPFRSMTDQLKEMNVRGILTLNEEYELRYLVNTEDEWKENDIEQLKLPNSDLIGSPSQEDLVKGVEFIKDVYARTGGSTYVHCKAGRTRSCTVVACYLMSTKGLDPDTAYKEIVEKRPHVWLREKQMESLKEFYESLSKDSRI